MLNKVLKYLIIIITILILIIIIATYSGIINAIIIFSIIFLLLYLINKKYHIEISENISSKKTNIIISMVLFFIAFIIRIFLLKILKIVPVSDFDTLLNASKQLSNRNKYIK